MDQTMAILGMSATVAFITNGNNTVLCRKTRNTGTKSAGRFFCLIHYPTINEHCYYSSSFHCRQHIWIGENGQNMGGNSFWENYILNRVALGNVVSLLLPPGLLLSDFNSFQILKFKRLNRERACFPFPNYSKSCLQGGTWLQPCVLEVCLTTWRRGEYQPKNLGYESKTASVCGSSHSGNRQIFSRRTYFVQTNTISP